MIIKNWHPSSIYDIPLTHRQHSIQILVLILMFAALQGCSLSAPSSSAHDAGTTPVVTPTPIPSSDFDGTWWGKGQMSGLAPNDAWYFTFQTTPASSLSSTAQECHRTPDGVQHIIGYVSVTDGTLQQSAAFGDLSLLDSSGSTTLTVSGTSHNATVTISGTAKTNDASAQIHATLTQGYVTDFQNLCASLPTH
jgi:hypothetical protein